jgi:hypothetical protein
VVLYLVDAILACLYRKSVVNYVLDAIFAHLHRKGAVLN